MGSGTGVTKGRRPLHTGLETVRSVFSMYILAYGFLVSDCTKTPCFLRLH